jgi:hypothetical protein
MKFNNWTPHFYVRFSKFRKRKQQKKGYPRSFKGLKNGLSFLFNPLRSGQVREAIKISKIEALGPPIYFVLDKSLKKWFSKEKPHPNAAAKEINNFCFTQKTSTFSLRYFCQ